MKTRIRHHLSTLAVAAIVAVALAGCKSDTVTADTQTQDPFAPPAYTEIAAAVSLNDAQGETVKAALADWRDASASRSATRRQGEFRRGEGPRALMRDFVVEVAPSLDTAQLSALVTFVTGQQRERMEAMRTQMRGRRGGRGPGQGHGPGDRRGPDGGFFAQLDLTADQQAALKDARDAMHETMRALHDQRRDGTITDEAFRTQADAARETFDAALAEILTEEQMTKLEALRSARMAGHLEQRLEHLGERNDQRLEFMTEVLGLTDAQQSAIRAIMAAAVEQERSIIESILAGDTTREDGRTALQELHTKTREAIEAELTEDQLARLEAVRPLRRGPGPGFGPGPGR